MKIIGAIMIGAACAYMGISKSMQMKNRHALLGRLVSALEMLDSEIRFNRTQLKKALYNTEDAINLKGFLKTAADSLDSLGIKKSWNSAADKCLKELTEADRTIVKMLSAKLGMTDAEGQIKQIEYVKNLLKQQTEAAEDEYKRLGRLYRNGGALIGAFIVIVLI